MQGLREPCPACADESQIPDLIHTPKQKLMHASRKVLVHARKLLSLLKTRKKTFFFLVFCDTSQTRGLPALTSLLRTSAFNLEVEWSTIVRTRAHVSAMVTMFNLACVFYA